MKKIIPILIIILFLTSCDSMYSLLDETKKITEKTTYKTFDHLNEPIVLSMPVQAKKYLFGNKNKSNKTEKLGEIFVIYDLENNEVFDWVFYGNSNETTWNLPVEMGQNPVCYFNPLVGSSQVVGLNPQKTSVDYYDVNNATLFYSNNTVGNYSVMDSYRTNDEVKKLEICFRIFNSETGEASNTILSQPVDCSGYITSLVPDEHGDLFFSYLYDGYGYIAKIDCENEKMDSFNSEILCKYNESDSDYVFATTILHVENGKIFLKVGKLGLGPYDENRLYLIDYETKSKTEINLPLEGDARLSRIVKVDGFFYGIVLNKMNSETCIQIYRINMDTKSTELINRDKPFFMSFTDNLWVRGTRIYFMNSWNTRNPYYNYYDVDTCTTGIGWTIKQSEIIPIN